MEQQDGTLLRIFLDTSRKWHFRPVYEVLVERARAAGLAGATVLEGLEGYGQNGHLLKEHPWRPTNQREVIVEIVDFAGPIDAFLASAEPLLVGTIVTLERAQVVSRGIIEEARS